MNLTFVVYLSRKRVSTLAQRRATDSVAASVVLTGRQADFFRRVAEECAEKEDQEIPTKAMEGTDQPIPLNTGALDDMCDDLVGNEDEYSANAKLIQDLCRNECLCTHVYLVVGGEA